MNYVTAQDPYGYGEELYTPAVSGEEIIVLPGTSGATDIPSFNGVTVPVSNITLDFTGTSITKSADENTLTASGNKWVSVLEYPSTIQYLRGVSAVKDRIYIPLPTSTNPIQMQNNVSDSNSTYSVYFDGTLADFAGRVKVSTSTGSAGFTEDGRPLYVRNADGKWINTSTAGLKFESEYAKSSGTATLTDITASLFNKIKTPSIELPDSVKFILDNAFCRSTARVVKLGSGLLGIGKGALYSETPRSVYYNGTIDDWMKVGCLASNGESADIGNGGPFLGGKDTFYVRNENGAYVRAYPDYGSLTVNLPAAITSKYPGNQSSSFPSHLNGQLQGLRKLCEVVINGEDDSETYKIGEYAFAQCQDLKIVKIYPNVSFTGGAVFNKTAVTELFFSTYRVF